MAKTQQGQGSYYDWLAAMWFGAQAAAPDAPDEQLLEWFTRLDKAMGDIKGKQSAEVGKLELGKLKAEMTYFAKLADVQVKLAETKGKDLRQLHKDFTDYRNTLIETRGRLEAKATREPLVMQSVTEAMAGKQGGASHEAAIEALVGTYLDPSMREAYSNDLALAPTIDAVKRMLGMTQEEVTAGVTIEQKFGPQGAGLIRSETTLAGLRRLEQRAVATKAGYNAMLVEFSDKEKAADGYIAQIQGPGGMQAARQASQEALQDIANLEENVRRLLGVDAETIAAKTDAIVKNDAAYQRMDRVATWLESQIIKEILPTEREMIARTVGNPEFRRWAAENGKKIGTVTFRKDANGNPVLGPDGEPVIDTYKPGRDDRRAMAAASRQAKRPDPLIRRKTGRFIKITGNEALSPEAAEALRMADGKFARIRNADGTYSYLAPDAVSEMLAQAGEGRGARVLAATDADGVLHAKVGDKVYRFSDDADQFKEVDAAPEGVVWQMGGVADASGKPARFMSEEEVVGGVGLNGAVYGVMDQTESTELNARLKASGQIDFTDEPPPSGTFEIVGRELASHSGHQGMIGVVGAKGDVTWVPEGTAQVAAISKSNFQKHRAEAMKQPAMAAPSTVDVPEAPDAVPAPVPTPTPPPATPAKPAPIETEGAAAARREATRGRLAEIAGMESDLMWQLPQAKTSPPAASVSAPAPAPASVPGPTMRGAVPPAAGLGGAVLGMQPTKPEGALPTAPEAKPAEAKPSGSGARATPVVPTASTPIVSSELGAFTAEDLMAAKRRKAAEAKAALGGE